MTRAPRGARTGRRARGVDSYVTDTGVLVRQRGTKRGSPARSVRVTIHDNTRWYNGLLKKLYKKAQWSSSGYPQIGQAIVRPSLSKLLGGVTISRRSAAGICADAQVVPCNDGERIVIA